MKTLAPVPALEFATPWMNAAGTLGFAPDVRGSVSLTTFGAFVTKPISVRARRTAQPPRLLPFPGGVLLHTGHPNPGLSSAIKNYAASWARSPIPVIVNLLSAKPEDLRRAVTRIEELENITAIELSVEPDVEPAELAGLAKLAAGELPLIVQLPLHRAAELIDAVLKSDAAAVSLGAPRGTLPSLDGKLVSGRLYGPALFPQALALTAQLAGQGLPLIAAGGVETKAQGEALLAAGAAAVQIDIALWKAGSI
jgi:dihydroorotate dehydrogenase (NAD+) catalytic subunit